jgi:ribosomal protein L11 methyltransferase
MNDTYLELSIAYNKQNRNIIYNRLYRENTGSIIEEHSHIKIYLPIVQKKHLKDITDKLLHLDGIPEKQLTVSEFSKYNWSDVWKKSIQPVNIKNKIIVYPSWKKNELKNTRHKILIEIDPKMSFGTGHNETTQLILEMMCKHITNKDKTMLDYGCGTSILAIAGIKLGLKSAVAIDTDNDAIINSRENIRINKVQKQVKLHSGKINSLKISDFDILAANLTSGIIVNNLKNISKKLKPAGKLFASGILKEEKYRITKALREYFIIKNSYKKSEWLGFYCIKK